MSRELRITLAIMAVALIVGAPLIFAAPGPANTNYLAMVMHIVAPTSIPALTATPLPPTPLKGIVNGSFEQQRTGWVEIPGNAIITQFAPGGAYDGQWVAWFGGEKNSTDELQQVVKVPSGGSIYLHYAYKVDANGSGYDAFEVYANTTRIDSDLILAYADWQDHSVNLSAYTGQTITVRFRLDAADYSPPSNVYIDAVRLASGP